jgi:elongation factor Ts
VTVSAADVKALRDRTGAGMMDCKAALAEADGDMDKAVEILRIKGQASAAKRGGRAAGEGVVSSYIHGEDQKIGVLVEVNCETDFVARTDQFKEFGRDLALHIAAAAPQWVSDDEVPDDAKESELRVLRDQAASDGKPPDVQEKIVQGRIEKWLDEMVLLRQEHVHKDKHGGKSIEDLRAEVAANTGENVVIRRFARFQIGEE